MPQLVTRRIITAQSVLLQDTAEGVQAINMSPTNEHLSANFGCCGRAQHMKTLPKQAQPATQPRTPQMLLPHLRTALQLAVQLLHCGLQLAHALATTHQQDGRHVLQQALRGSTCSGAET